MQAASAFTVWAISSGGETLRVWLLTAFFWLMTLPLLAGIEGVGHVAFTHEDVIRHELVARIVEAYDRGPLTREVKG